MSAKREKGARDARMSRGNLAAATEARQRRQTLLGGVLVAVLLALALAVFLLDPLVAALRSDRDVVVVTSAAPGVVPGAPVWIAGHQVGQVSSVEFLPVTAGEDAPRIALTLSVPTSHARLIRQDARARITSARLVGEPVIDIEPGSPDAPALAPSDTLFMAESLSGPDLMAHAQVLRLALDSLIVAAAPVGARVRTRMRDLARLQEGFADSQAELARLSDAIATSAARDFAADPALGRALERLRAAVEANEALRADDAGIARVQAALVPLMTHARRLDAQLDSLRLRGGPNGTLPRLQGDSALALAVRRTQAQLDSLIAEVSRNPLRFVF